MRAYIDAFRSIRRETVVLQIKGCHACVAGSVHNMGPHGDGGKYPRFAPHFFFSTYRIVCVTDPLSHARWFGFTGSFRNYPLSNNTSRASQALTGATLAVILPWHGIG